MNMVTWIAYMLCSVGAMNWGLAKFFDFNLVEYLGDMLKLDYFKESLYAIVSLSGLYVLIHLFV